MYNDIFNLLFVEQVLNSLKTLHVDWCTSMERITFQSARFTLDKFCYVGCFNLFEIEGLFKLVSIAELDRIRGPPFAKIRNKSKGLTWVYNPVVFLPT
ncbi:hypothetical protein Hanom_Chr03g00188831 [Helianthus anomalus]